MLDVPVMRGIMSIGNDFHATMTLSDGSTVEADTKDYAWNLNWNQNGWTCWTGTGASGEQGETKATCTFDFSSQLLGKPWGIATREITFYTNKGSSATPQRINTIVVNGMKVYKHQW